MTPIWMDEDVLVEFVGMQNEADNQYINNATVTWSLKTAELTAVANGSMTYKAGSNGTYQGTIAAATTVALTENTHYVLDVEGASPEMHRRTLCVARYRGKT